MKHKLFIAGAVALQCLMLSGCDHDSPTTLTDILLTLIQTEIGQILLQILVGVFG